MKAATLVLLCLALLGAAMARQEPAPQKNRPVAKVLNLLKDMQTALAKEAEEDEKVYEQLDCWCKTNDKEKSASIAEAEKRIAELTTFVEQAAALISQLETEISNLEKEIASNREALAQALAIREKERAEFAAASKELAQAISALKSATVVLSKHHSKPAPAEALINIASILHHHMHKFSGMLSLTHKQKRVIESFIQQPKDFFGASPSFKQAYAPQSGEVFGILENMLETFEADLKEAEEEEASKEHAYQDLKVAKEAEISAAEESRENKKHELADTQNKLANAKQDIEDTRNSLAADQQFLVNLKEKCQQTDAEWAERQKTRAEETEAVTKAVAVLSSDDAHDLFTRTFNNGASFVQVNAKVSSYKRQRVARLLKRVAKRVGDSHAPQLIQIAAAAALDSFTQVKEAIDALVVGLQKEQADEAAHKDWCNAEFNENEAQTTGKSRDKSDLVIKIDGLTQQIDSLTKEVAVLEAEIAELQKQVQAAGEDREKENLDFQATVKDAQETQKLLAQAADVLKAFYNKSLLQKEEPVAPTKFNEYKKQGGSGVLALLEAIVADSARLEKEAIQAEQDSQAAYETFVKDSNNSVEAKQRDITNKQETKAVAEADLTAAKEDLASVESELASLSEYAAQIHTACDFVLKNFEIRQTARAQEIEALGQAKAILSGARFD
jgi:chromosome segregation ATPase